MGPTGCENLSFDIASQLRATTRKPDAPTGLGVDLSMAQDGLSNTNGPAAAHLRNARVTLPEGLTINPSGADGLDGCTDVQLGLKTNSPIGCPDGAKIGSVTARTPLLDDPVDGAIYVRSQNSDDPASGEMFRVALVIDDPERGLLIKLPGSVKADPATGRLQATFEDNPQLPVAASR